MSIQSTINTTISVIQGCVTLVKNTIAATVQGLGYLFTHFPQVLNSAWEVFKGSLKLGQYLMTLGLQALKYVALNIPEIAKGLYNLTIEVFKHLPEVLKFVGYTVPKFFLYEIPKAAIGHLPAIANWFAKHLPELIAHGVGVTVGIVYAPFKITYDLMFGKNNHHQDTPTIHNDDPLAEALVVGVVGAALVADGFTKDISDIESDMARRQNQFAPGYERHKAQHNASSLDTHEPMPRVKNRKLSSAAAA